MGNSCYSSNACDMRTYGSIRCDGSCSAIAPADSLCPLYNYCAVLPDKADPGDTVTLSGMLGGYQVPLTTGPYSCNWTVYNGGYGSPPETFTTTAATAPTSFGCPLTQVVKLPASDDNLNTYMPSIIAHLSISSANGYTSPGSGCFASYTDEGFCYGRLTSSYSGGGGVRGHPPHPPPRTQTP